MIKLELQTGSSSIKVEGNIEDVERILAVYWLPSSAGDESARDDEAGATSNVATKRKTRRTASKPALGEPGSRSDALDAEQIANAIKTHDAFIAMKAKVLDVKGDWISKCKMVALVANAPITSGDVARVLTALRVKAPLPRLSLALSGNSTDFITRGVSPVKYTMTSAAEAAFRTWLAEPAKEAA